MRTHRTPCHAKRRGREAEWGWKWEWVSHNRFALKCSSKMRKQQPQTIVLLLIICPFPWAIHDTCCCCCCCCLCCCYGCWCRERYCELTSLQFQRKRSVHIYSLLWSALLYNVTMYYFAFHNTRNWYLLYGKKNRVDFVRKTGWMVDE